MKPFKQYDLNLYVSTCASAHTAQRPCEILFSGNFVPSGSAAQPVPAAAAPQAPVPAAAQPQAPAPPAAQPQAPVPPTAQPQAPVPAAAPSGNKPWAENKSYKVGDAVQYNGKEYACLQQHVSNSGWSPLATGGILWREVQTVQTSSISNNAATNAWKESVMYARGDTVTYNSHEYTCLTGHMSNAAWTPALTNAILWKTTSATASPATITETTTDPVVLGSAKPQTGVNEPAVRGLQNAVHGVYDVGDVIDLSGDSNIENIACSNPAVLERKGNTFKVVRVGTTCMKIVLRDGAVRLYGVFVKGSFETQRVFTASQRPRLGSVSEDDPLTSMKFWTEFDGNSYQRYCDIRYIYLNGGPGDYGWRMNYSTAQWNTEPLGQRAVRFLRNSLRLGMIPCFVYYNIPDNGESYFTNLQHIQDIGYMRSYFADLMFLLDTINKECPTVSPMLVFEPDFLGYLMQNSGAGSVSKAYKYPNEIKAHVSPAYDYIDRASSPAFADNVQDLVKCINYMVSTKCKHAHIGWQINVWSSTYSGKWIPGGKSLMKVTDTVGWKEGREIISREAREIARYYIAAGIGSCAHFFSVDKYGLSFRGVNRKSAMDSEWGWNHDHWMNYLMYCEELGKEIGLPCVLWQMPSAHLNSSMSKNPQTGKPFADMPNVSGAYEDSSATFFFGDTFKPSAEEYNYFAKNASGVEGVIGAAGIVSWPGAVHGKLLERANVVAVLSGAGVGDDTHSGGLARPITDDHFFISKVQACFGGRDA